MATGQWYPAGQLVLHLGVVWMLIATCVLDGRWPYRPAACECCASFSTREMVPMEMPETRPGHGGRGSRRCISAVSRRHLG